MTAPSITSVERLILTLHYREGWSLRRIGDGLGLHPEQVRRALDSACDGIAGLLLDSDCDARPFIEGLLSFEDGGGPRQQPRIAALRHEQLAQDLEQHMGQRSKELAEVSECMGADCPVSHKRSKGAEWTHWERRYLCARGVTSIPEYFYKPKRSGYTPAHFCANDESCNLGCVGCPHARH